MTREHLTSFIDGFRSGCLKSLKEQDGMPGLTGALLGVSITFLTKNYPFVSEQVAWAVVGATAMSLGRDTITMVQIGVKEYLERKAKQSTPSQNL